MKVGTHNGPFHADDVFACAILKKVYPSFELVRSRDVKVLGLCTILVDVGGEYNGVDRFDHHQIGGAGERENGVKHSSAGLVWKRYGAMLLGNEECAKVVDEELIQTIDRLDNGQGGEVNSFSVSSAISVFNPTWQENCKEEDFYRSFTYAMEFAENVLERVIASAKGKVDARNAVLAKMGEPIVVLDSFLPAMETVVEDPNAMFLVYPSVEGTWMVQCVPPYTGSFGQRLPLPLAWAGKRDMDLAEASGVHDSVFCHNNRFIAGSKTKQGALRLAEKALCNRE
jgi:uncharacterized UPF0160 family protein